MSLSVKIAGSRDIILLFTEFNSQSAPNAIDCMKVNTIAILPGTVRQISRLILQDSKQNKGNHIPINLTVQTAETIIK